MLFGKKNKMKLADLLEDFILHCEARARSRKSSYNYHWRVKLFLAQYGHLKPKELKKSDLQRFKRWVEDEKDYTESSLDAIIQGVKAFCTWLREEGYIATDISQAIHRKQIKARPNAGAISKSGANTVLARAETKREIALILFLIDTGARRGEVASVTINAIDWETGVVIVDGKTGERPVTMLERTKAAMLDYLHNERPEVAHDFFFCNVQRPYRPMTEFSLYQLCKRLGADLDTFTHPHAYRHLVANAYALGEGGDVYTAKEKLGHKSITTTTTYYIRADVRHLQTKDKTLSALHLLE